MRQRRRKRLGAAILLRPDARWTEAAGFEAIQTNVFARLGSDWDNYHTEIEGPDTFIAYGTCKGTYLATGKYVEARVAALS